MYQYLKSFIIIKVPFFFSLPQNWHEPHGEKISGNAADNVVVYRYDVKSPQRQSRGLKSTVYNPLNLALLPVSQLCTSVSQVNSTCLLLSVVNVKDDGSFINTKFGKFSKGSPLAFN